jgi:hypothetical protein
MFGQEAHLPVDSLLGNTQADDEEHASVDDWVLAHRQRLADAYKCAGYQLDKHAEDRKRDITPNVPPLDVGDVVLLRNRVAGRNKIQDAWEVDRYVVAERISDSVYSVEPMGNGKAKIIYRKDLRPVENHLPVARQGKPVPAPRKKQHCIPTPPKVKDSEDESEEEAGFWVVAPTEPRRQVIEPRLERAGQPEPQLHLVDEPPELDVEEAPVPLRRTTRTTAGHNPNPYNLPQSAVQRQTAIINLTSKLGACLLREALPTDGVRIGSLYALLLGFTVMPTFA